ncbi:DNA/RNA helicase domain-containing protein [Streptomonospora wellingtoniae]|uniref:DUF2075 domain-containing protein n=1 Tax=Streptomonospora wellingtoniae TaxID=3075544 RepID=A0ABU2KY77_9ACTN|nr:DNA/RNA helicase domain-containing protein [Streptomonospora sp. DSM 45055]MDT0304261.1 DUF2075 domain-containing protein [Streptomonospora sp. DSM 45055]
MQRRFFEIFGESADSGEARSWRNSIPTVVERLTAAGLGGVQVLLEMSSPLTDIRMDMVLVGSRPGDGRMSVVLVENKQWSRVAPASDSELVRPGNSRTGMLKVHPVNQVWGYRQALLDFIPLLRDADVFCIVNMHNADRAVLNPITPSAQQLSEVGEMRGFARMYGHGEERFFERALREFLSAENADTYAQELIDAPVAPTEPLMSAVSSGVRNRSVFTLLDEQREAYDYVKSRVAKSKKSDHKEVVLIVGGPGTGKSVIALELLDWIGRNGHRAVHATGSKAFTVTLRTKADAKSSRTRQIYQYFNNFSGAAPNDLDAVIADEAHRLRSAGHRSNEQESPQVEELIRAARVPVFLLDEYQRVRPSEVGSVELITKTAEAMGIGVHTIDLRHQFRCGGSPEFLSWTERLLGLDDDGNPPEPWRPQSGFELHVASSPSAMEEYLRARLDEGYSSRIAAGFCWPWNKPRPDGTLIPDVVIGDWRHPWNAKSDHPLEGAPSSSLWATDDGGFDQVGCIYTAQGFEYDYAGVLIGPDLVWNGTGWAANRSANMDTSIKRAPDFDLLVRHTYRVLATRGLRGAVLYSTDPETNRFLTEDLGVPVL